MKHIALACIAVLAAAFTASAAPGDVGVRDRLENRWDRRENRWDRREDWRDIRHRGGWLDRAEDVRDRRENRWDRRENRWDRRENRIR